MTEPEAAADLAAAFLLAFWRDDRRPEPIATEDAFGSPVWRFSVPQDGRDDGLEGMLTIDIDRRDGYVCGVRFKPALKRRRGWRASPAPPLPARPAR